MRIYGAVVLFEVILMLEIVFEATVVAAVVVALSFTTFKKAIIYCEPVKVMAVPPQPDWLPPK